MEALKNAQISLEILKNIQSGMSVNQALDAVLGQGAFAGIASDVYDALKSKAAAKVQS